MWGACAGLFAGKLRSHNVRVEPETCARRKSNVGAELAREEALKTSRYLQVSPALGVNPSV